MLNSYNAKIGSEVVLSPRSRHPQTVTIVSRRDNPNGGKNRLVKVKIKNQREVTHEIRPNGSVSFWYWGE